MSRPLPHPPGEPGHEAIHAYPPANLASAPYSAQLFGTAEPHPADIDRRNLIGVGELSTPRWPGSDQLTKESRVTSVGLYSPSFTGECSKTPPNSSSSRHSTSHDILKQFAVKDFSHLPPSPSSASINQFLRSSGSTQNISSGTPPGSAPASGAYFSSKGVQREDSQKSQKHQQRTTPKPKELDPNVDEALRKLDGLTSTPGKNKARGKSSGAPSAASSRPGTPVAVAIAESKSSRSESKIPLKPSIGSFKDTTGSPLNNWIDLTDDIPAIPIPRARIPPHPNRESSSSASATATTMSSADLAAGNKPPPPPRRASGGSETSAQGGMNADHQPEGMEKRVPPVPPLPQAYVNKKQHGMPPTVQSGGMQPPSYVSMHELSPEPLPSSPSKSTSPLTTATTAPVPVPPKMHKKWSFSSALNLKSAASPVSSVDEMALSQSPQTPWSEIHRGELFSPNVHVQGQEPRGDSGPRQGATPLAPPPPPSSSSSSKASSSNVNKRLTPSSIPFFRRSSSSSFHKANQSVVVPETPKQVDKTATAAAAGTTAPTATAAAIPSSQSQSRKSVLGMHFPSMLRKSSSKRGLAQQATQQHAGQSQVPVKEKEEVKAASAPGATSGWTGRKRGKTLSISGDLPKPFPGLKHQSSAEISFGTRGSAVSNGSDATISSSNTYDRLPAIKGSPARPPPPDGPRYSNSPRNLPSATPTKIPRMAQRPAPSPATVTAHSGMPPPPFPTAKKISNTVSGAGGGGPAVSEFGLIDGMIPTTPRLTTSGAHRAHLLAPMSARHDTRRVNNRTFDPPVRKDTYTSGVPPSRRQLPQPPTSTTVTSMTLSASAKRASREFKKKQESKDPPDGGWSSSGKNSPVKPSKSMHSSMVVPSSSRLPSSSSAGAPGSNYRSRLSLADDESSSMSPADDDEANGDAEMEAYIKRRRERAAVNKKDNLSDVTEFPRDITPVEPLSQRAFITNNLAKMSDAERKEVLDFDHIYYSPTPSTIRRPSQPGGATYNHGYDDERGDYLVVEGDHLCYRYEVVVQCRDHKTGRSVAVKIIRNKKRFHTQALVEVKILQQLVEWDPEDKHFMVRMTDSFSFRNHLCIVTELLSINLYELIKANHFAGFSTVLIRRFTTQILGSLQLMRSHRIVHCDLKPENILLCHPAKSAIKVIDFGSSCLETEKVYTYIQSRFYRSPEVILGMNYAMAIDMWSLGCILAELYTGVPIFPGENEHEQLACIMEVLGVPDRYLIEKASRRKNFFDATGAPRPFVNAKGRRRRPGSKTLAGVLKCDDELFVDFIARCLTWDPDKRLKPQPAMRHPWILAGRKRYAPTPSRDEKRAASERSSRLFGSSHTSTRISSKNLSELSSPSIKDKDKSKLLISSPVPLAPARHAYHSSIASTSRIGQAMSSSRLAHQTSARSGSFNTSELSIG
uniref:CMGC/DYRK/DYRK2 protein kinase n=1 Tax=Cryptococcus bacillisporus CA1280 TaxID=1296109 RepID=A0A0D0VFJ0_CRYGA|nr:CMGC/DYRK/DYRK2 protein kinase [Cryptococcus bacillisporus CA1280]